MPLESVEVTESPPERFDEVLTSDALAMFQRSIARGHELLRSRAIWNVNSTAFGVGVAEMLRSLIGYVRGAGIDGRWVIIEGDEEFFRITKRLHNRLHGVRSPVGLSTDTCRERRAYGGRSQQGPPNDPRRRGHGRHSSAHARGAQSRLPRG